MSLKFNPFTGTFYVSQPSVVATSAFTIIQGTAGTSPTSDSTTDTLILTSSDSKAVITGNATTDTLDFTFPTLVVGPSSAVDNALARFDLTTGKIIQSSVITLSDAGIYKGVDTAAGTTGTSLVFKAGTAAGGASDNGGNITFQCGDAAQDGGAGLPGSFFFVGGLDSDGNPTAAAMTVGSVDAYSLIVGAGGASISGGLVLPNGLSVSSNATFSYATASTVPYLDASKNLVSSGVTPTQLSYLDATSSIQTQLNGKQASGAYITSLAGEATGSGAGAATITLTNSAVIGKVLTGYTSGAGTVASTDTILQAIQKLNGNVALKQANVTWLSAAFGSGGTRVTATPAAVGEFRSMLRQASARTFTDTNGAPTFTPTTASGFRIYNGNTWASADNNNEPSWYQVYIGLNLQGWRVYAWSGTSKSGIVSILPFTEGSGYIGYSPMYDPTTGLLTLAPTTSAAHTSHSSALDTTATPVNDVYIDIAYW